ncbi:MAG: hypothetical protein Q9O24_05060 [Gammaproteobacteria bacterium]|nr:hypothetical protein [Gammaproteobacteria bacterium]
MNAAQGWYIRLQESNGAYVGEKGLAAPLIVEGQAVVTTYAPIASAASAVRVRPAKVRATLIFSILPMVLPPLIKIYRVI